MDTIPKVGFANLTMEPLSQIAKPTSQDLHANYVTQITWLPPLINVLLSQALLAMFQIATFARGIIIAKNVNQATNSQLMELV